jgi:hypothetical protein
MEPEKCEGWEWFDIQDLPSPRFATVDRIMKAWTLATPGQAVVFDKE